jgi:3-demethoxyubiquinol 3-hydroxylase
LYDVAVVGGGMVGSACAIGLAQLGLSVALIERDQPKAFNAEQLPDLRVSAINRHSEHLFEELGAWSLIQNMRVCPYRRLSVWEQPQCRSDFNSAALGVSHLGHIIENRIIQLGLLQRCQQLSNLTVYMGQTIKSLVLHPSPSITLTNDETLHGVNSMVRQKANIGVQGWQYGMQALGISIRTKQAQQDITWQQFTPDGPVAFLPLFAEYASLVWYNRPEKVRELKGLSVSQLKQQIIQHFPAELMDFEVLACESFPLIRQHTNQYTKGDVVLIGDAAHSINPLAGQGVNLGFKDVRVLLEVLTKYRQDMTQTKASPSLRPYFGKYERNRRPDNLLMMSAMDVLYKGFCNQHGVLKLLRNAGLTLANHAGPLKHRVMQYAMGL